MKDVSKLKNYTIIKQEYIPVGCVLPVLHYTGGFSVELDRNPLNRDPRWTETPWTKIPRDRDPPSGRNIRPGCQTESDIIQTPPPPREQNN